MADRALARKVLATEAAAILALVDRLDERFDRAVDLLRDCRGRVILTGMGKSGIICQKIAATLSSTGTPALFLHPADAIHGDLGVIQADDVVVALSYSGETDEIVRLLEFIRRLGAKLIAITGARRSTLGQAADVTLDCSVTEEACPMNLVPTASTTAALAIGDALAMTLLVEKGFKQEDFANLHPGGTLGKQPDARRVADARRQRTARVVRMTRRMQRRHRRDVEQEARHDLRRRRHRARSLGVITDGDLRRQIERASMFAALRAADVMTRGPVAIARATLAAEALHIMETRQDHVARRRRAESNHVAGVVHLHDLWRTEMI